MKQVVNDIIEADNRSDIQTVLSLYDSNAILMPPNRNVILGKDAIRRNYEQIFASSQLHLITEIESVTLQQSLAVVTGNNKGNVISVVNSSSQAVNSKYIMILHKKSLGRWLIQSLIWNDNEVR